MERNLKIFWVKMVVAGSAIPLALWAYEYGPNPGFCGVPFENGGANGATCTTLMGCHTGTTNDPANKGSVAINFPNGMTYTPGVAQHLTVTISDPAATQQAWGFQLTARPAGIPATMAGSFGLDDNNTQIMCSQPNLQVFGAVCLPGAGEGCSTPSNAPACPSAEPLQYVEHSFTGFTNSRGHQGSYTYQLDWMPDATSACDVQFYVAGNAGVNTGTPTQNNDHIYATSYTLTAAPAGAAPSIRTSQGVGSASDFGVFSATAPGNWIQIYGSNLAPNVPAAGISWSGCNFNNGTAPTSLAGVSVNVGGQAAFISYVSPTQVNALVPSNVGTGTQSVIVNNGAGSSAPYSMTVNATEPGLLAPAAFIVGGKQYVVAQHNDGTFVLPAGAIPGVASSPATVGEVIVMWGVGFGSVNPSIPAGQAVTQLNQLSQTMLMNFGSTPATLQYDGLAPNFTGLYQFNVMVPNVPSNNAVPLSFTLGGVAGGQTLYTAVQ